MKPEERAWEKYSDDNWEWSTRSRLDFLAGYRAALRRDKAYKKELKRAHIELGIAYACCYFWPDPFGARCFSRVLAYIKKGKEKQLYSSSQNKITSKPKDRSPKP